MQTHPPSTSPPFGLFATTPEGLQEIIGTAVKESVAAAVQGVLNTMTVNTPRPLEEELLSREETARALRVHVRTLRTWELNGRLVPTKRLGRRVLYSRDAVLAASNPTL